MQLSFYYALQTDFHGASFKHFPTANYLSFTKFHIFHFILWYLHAIMYLLAEPRKY